MLTTTFPPLWTLLIVSDTTNIHLWYYLHAVLRVTHEKAAVLIPQMPGIGTTAVSIPGSFSITSITLNGRNTKSTIILYHLDTRIPNFNTRKDDFSMTRKKNKTVDELRAAEAKALRERDEKNALIKELHKQISEAARRERNAHIYFRGGELTHHLGDKAELLTDDDVKRLLNYVFSFGGVQKIVNEMLAIRRGDANGTVEELLSTAMSGDKRAPIRSTDVQTS